MNYKSIIDSNELVLVDFFATWCGPCKAMNPVLKQVKAEFGKQLSVVKIDVDKNQKLAAKEQVRGVPTLALYKNGKLKWKQSGAMNLAQLKSKIASQIT